MSPLLLIPFLTFTAVLALGAAAVTARAARRQPIHDRLRHLGPAADPPAAPGMDRPALTRALARLGYFLSSGQPSPDLRAELAQAGYHHASAPAIYLGLKALLFLASFLLFTFLTGLLTLPLGARLLLTLTAAGAVSFLPNAAVSLRRQRRTNQIRRHLPDVIDLLEICISAGMGLDFAWNAVTDEIRRVSPILADEMALTNLEIHLGASRAQALRHMAQRTGADDLISLVGVLVQSERFGTSIAEALRTFTISLREIRSQRAEEAAERTAVKLLFPMVLFIFPAMLIVLAGPAIITLTTVFD